MDEYGLLFGCMECRTSHDHLYENGDVEIDTKADRKARIPLDTKIPVDEQLARAIFETEDDAELNYVLEHCMN